MFCMCFSVEIETAIVRGGPASFLKKNFITCAIFLHLDVFAGGGDFLP